MTKARRGPIGRVPPAWLLADACLRDPALWRRETKRPSWLPWVDPVSLPIIRDPRTGLWLPLQAAFALVNHLSWPAGINGDTTPSIDTTGADFLVMTIAWDDSFSGTPTVSDSKGNSWNPRTTYDDGSHGGTTSLKLFYAFNTAAKVGTGHTFTVSGALSFSSIAVQAFSGSQTSSDPYDVENGQGLGSGLTFSPGSVTPSVDNELLITGFGTNDDWATLSVNLSYAITDAEHVTGTSHGVAMAYLIETTAAAKNPTWTRDTSHESAVNSATFKAAGAAGTFFALIG